MVSSKEEYIIIKTKTRGVRRLLWNILFKKESDF
jgi:hypothetical protein